MNLFESNLGERLKVASRLLCHTDSRFACYVLIASAAHAVGLRQNRLVPTDSLDGLIRSWHRSLKETKVLKCTPHTSSNGIKQK